MVKLVAASECPKCDSNKVVKIAYGLPTPDTFKKEQEGKLVPAGCSVVDGVSPKWHCNFCGHDWGLFGRKDPE